MNTIRVSNSLDPDHAQHFVRPDLSPNCLPYSVPFHLDLHGERSGSVLDSRPRGHEFEPHWCHCVVVLEQDTFILA